MSDGIIPTPEQAMKILSMPLADLEERKEIRVPCGTPEKGLEAIDFVAVMARITALENRTLDASLPVGYIYVQLPSQPAPNVLYPKATWSNISSSYAGNFFRVEGGLASAFESGKQLSSAPNITGRQVVFSNTSAAASYGAFSGIGSPNGYVQNVMSDSVNYRVFTSFSATESNSVYGRRNEVAPQNQTIRIWRKTGTISGTRSYALIDDDGIYQQTVELGEDEAGIIGYNPHIHIDTPPAKNLQVKRSNHEVLRYNQEHEAWEIVEDYRGRTAYKIDGSGSRIIHQLGESIADDESWLEPEG